MTANELADKLKIFWHCENDNLFEEAATMLRQQQAEIELLKQIIDANNLNQNIGQFVNEGTPDSELAEHKRIIRQQQAEIEALKKAIVEYADCVGSIEGKDFIGDLKYMGTSKESIALLYKLNGYDEHGKEKK